MPIIYAIFSALVLSTSPAAASEIQAENPLVIERLKFVAATNTAYIFARGGTSCPARDGELRPLKLPLHSPEAEVLYSLLLSAHLGERKLAVWFDSALDCSIVQGQLMD